MTLLKRVLALLVGWMLALTGLAMAGAGHALWQAFGAATLHVGLLQAATLVVVADAIFVGLLLARGSERSKVILGFFAVGGLFVSVAAFGAIRHAW